MTPPQVDELFAAAWDQRHELLDRAIRSWDDVFYAAGARQVSRRGWNMPLAEAEGKARTAATEEPDGSAARALGYLNGLKAQIAELDRTVLAKLEAEENRRGGWNRAYLAMVNGRGHVHKTRRCSTCNKGEFDTRFDWKIEWSGKSEAEIIEAAGERACTVCYPNAPTSALKRPTQMFSRSEIEAAKERERRAEAKAERDRKAALNAITLPDGTPLRDEVDRNGKQRGSIVKTLRTARSELKQECWYQYAWGDEGGSHERNIQHLARAVAWKEKGLAIGAEPTEEEIQAVIEPLRKKAVKEVDKARREQH
jgi:hypothetical protein